VHVVALGNAFDGLSLHGPFEDVEDAVDYAEQSYQGEDYHIVPLGGPEPRN
jgi:hypothetical protein